MWGPRPNHIRCSLYSFGAFVGMHDTIDAHLEARGIQIFTTNHPNHSPEASNNCSFPAVPLLSVSPITINLERKHVMAERRRLYQIDR